MVREAWERKSKEFRTRPIVPAVPSGEYAGYLAIHAHLATAAGLTGFLHEMTSGFRLFADLGTDHQTKEGADHPQDE